MEQGFIEWFPVKTLAHSNLPSDQGIVLVIVDQELSGKKESDILYIGRTKKPAKRIMGGYLGGYGGKNAQKINQKLLDEGYIGRVAISWVATEKPRITQKELLAKYKGEHGNLPAWNAKKKVEEKPKETPPYRRKQAPALKAKTAPKAAEAPKTAETPKSRSKPRATSRKAAAPEAAGTEPKKEEKAEAEKPRPSESSMPT